MDKHKVFTTYQKSSKIGGADRTFEASLDNFKPIDYQPVDNNLGCYNQVGYGYNLGIGVEIDKKNYLKSADIDEDKIEQIKPDDKMKKDNCKTLSNYQKTSDFKEISQVDPGCQNSIAVKMNKKISELDKKPENTDNYDDNDEIWHPCNNKIPEDWLGPNDFEIDEFELKEKKNVENYPGQELVNNNKADKNIELLKRFKLIETLTSPVELVLNEINTRRINNQRR
ncbi:510_t:CDS:2 [Dentiscutata erythropus]|uniref:510_t:CDS:1 n=1 Tax=Dentiscutata erythropus TaxID=1348616 RepID=A0A9N9D9B5_9GLOM|nr:510_t:CDS:2 [Dentiscutata erythropus]